MRFVINQHLQTKFFAKTLSHCCFVFKNSAREVVGDAGVEGSVAFVGDNVGVVGHW